ncbi:VOC family protein [Cellulosimicrobium composti]|uniref:VOC family protein n=1 Tax=Cellulosimicrobium composti TaxID=2672572 RepID=UPI000E246CE2
MATQLSPYLNFDGDAREAVEFYGRVFGTTPDISTYDSVGPVDDPALATKVLHAQLTIEGVGTLMASDVPPGTTLTDRASVALSGETGDRERLRAWFAALSEDAQELTLMETAPWGDEFGMLRDRFGVGWLVNVAAPTS